jgi:hypothetical protein
MATVTKTNSLLGVLPGTRLLGEIITWSASGASLAHRALIEALRETDLDESVARELAPRHAFSRACKKLSEDRIIRQLAEDADTIRFQFTAEHREGEHYRYDLETVLTLEKATGRVRCDLPGLATLAQEALDECIVMRNGGDITRVVQRLFERQADLFPIRENGGCYFVPQEHAAFVDRIGRFIRRINGSLRRFPVPAGTPHGDRSVQESVAAGLGALIAEHEAAIAGFGEDTRPDTLDRAAERIRLTRHKVEAYAEYLGDEKARLERALAEASAHLRARVSELAPDRTSAASSPAPSLL